MEDRICPVLLCGGTGTRLWPLSRDSYPKQFARLIGNESLLQRTVIRMEDAGFAHPVILTGDNYRFMVGEQLRNCSIQARAILIEPEPRNTAPAVLAAAYWLIEDDPVMIVAPTDHLIPSAAAFRDVIAAALPFASEGSLVTFGVSPNCAETGYGWIQTASKTSDHCHASDVIRFVEKPDKATAESMLNAGNFLWNSGIFLFRASAIIDAFQRHCPDLLVPVKSSVASATKDLDFVRLDPDSWSDTRSVSIDYAVMESASNLKVMPFSSDWSDLGDWNAIWRESEKDESGVVEIGKVIGIDCQQTLLRAEEGNQALVGLGLDNIVAIAMADAVLVAERGRVQQVREVVTALRAQNMYQADRFLFEHRPWGKFMTLTSGDQFHVKRITVNPNGILSLQSHSFRSEHWVVVEGIATVTLGDQKRTLSENESVYIPVGTKHRLENRESKPLTIIEVQTGSYFGEDDIVRYDDHYARGQETKSIPPVR